MRISVIIPTLNEEAYIKKTLASIGQDVEIIVVDGGSFDSTIAIASDFTQKAIVAEKGRGAQMDKGATKSVGDILMFLHADTILPENWKECIENVFKDDNVIGGGFRLRIESNKLSFRIIEAVANLRAKYLNLIYGDQAIFVKREAFFSSGGFMGVPIMEDVDLIRRLKKRGKIVMLDESVFTSPRLWLKKGILKTTMRNIYFILLYYIGVSPQRIYRLYYE